MEFTTMPPTSFEIGKARQYYEERTSDFFYSDEPWGTSFTAKSSIEGSLRGISGSFTDGRVTGLSLLLLPGDTFRTIPVDLPAEQFYYELGVYYSDVTIYCPENDETVCSIDQPTNALLIEFFYTKDEPIAIHWTMRKDGDNGK